MNDLDLLRQFAERQTESAFANLVTRYSGLVYAVALRQVHNPHLAEDVTQTVFLLLARKARKLSRGTILSGWLFQTTRFVSADAMKTEMRRKNRERQAMELGAVASPSESTGVEGLVPFVNESIGCLKPVERDAVLLRFFEKKTFLDIGLALGVTEEAARKRVDRALEKMRLFFGRKGITISAVALGGAIETLFSTSAPPALAGILTKAALSVPVFGFSQALWHAATASPLKTALAGGAFLAVTAAAWVQWETNSRLSNANRELRQNEQQLLAASQRQGEELRAARDEILSLQRATTELHRLRNEVGQWKRGLADASEPEVESGRQQPAEAGPRAFELRLVSAEPSGDTESVSMSRLSGEGEWIEVKFEVRKTAALDEALIEAAGVQKDPLSGASQVWIRFDERGREQLAEITKENLNKQLAVFVGGKLKSVPVVRNQIADGQAVVEAATEDEAKQMAALVNDSVRQRQ